MKTTGFILKIAFGSVISLFIIGSLIGILFYLGRLSTIPTAAAPAFLGFYPLFFLIFILPAAGASFAARLIFLSPLTRFAAAEPNGPAALPRTGVDLRKARNRLYRMPIFTFLLNATVFALALPAFAASAGWLAGAVVLKLSLYIVLGLAAACLCSSVQTTVDYRIMTPLYRMFEGYPPERKDKKTRPSLRFILNLLFVSAIAFSLPFFMNVMYDLDRAGAYQASLLQAVAQKEMTIERAVQLSASGTDAAAVSGTAHPLSIAAMCLLIGILVVGCVFPYTASLRRRVLNQRSLMENILCGNDFFKRRISVVERDEIGLSSLTINRFIDKFKEILEAILTSTDSVQNISGTLDHSLLNASAAIEEMVTTIRQITANTSAQKSVVNNVRGKIEEMLIGIDGTSFDVVELSNFVQETSSAMHETTTSMQTIAKNTEQVNGLAGRLMEISQNGSLSMNETVTSIREIEKASIQVASIVNVISDIAARTNLLSLNASIEAAHAGDKGKGFAVVASEIRKLAEQSHENIALIEHQIENMSGKVKAGVALTTAADASFRKIHEDIQLTGQHINQVTIALQEQNQGSREIMTALEEMVKKTVEVKEIAEDLKRRSEEIHGHVEDLFVISLSIADATGEQDKGNKDILDLISTIVNASRNNLSVVDSLHSIVNEYQAGQGKTAAIDKPAPAPLSVGQ